MYGMVRSTNTWKISNITLLFGIPFCQNGRFWSNILGVQKCPCIFLIPIKQISEAQSGTMRSDCHSTSTSTKSFQNGEKCENRLTERTVSLPKVAFPSVSLMFSKSSSASSNISGGSSSIGLLSLRGRAVRASRATRWRWAMAAKTIAQGVHPLVGNLGQVPNNQPMTWLKSHVARRPCCLWNRMAPPTHMAGRPGPSSNTLISLPYHCRPKSNSTINQGCLECTHFRGPFCIFPR